MLLERNGNINYPTHHFFLFKRYFTVYLHLKYSNMKIMQKSIFIFFINSLLFERSRVKLRYALILNQTEKQPFNTIP